MSHRVVAVAGKPGAGKSSVCREALPNIAVPEHTSLSVFSVGAHIRRITNGSEFSRYTRQLEELRDDINGMNLIDDGLVGDIVEEYLTSRDRPAVTLIDGFPLKTSQLPMFNLLLRRNNLVLSGCLSFVVSDAVAIQRQLERVSTDSHPDYAYEQACRRVATFNNDTRPAIDAICTTIPLQTIDAEQDFNLVCGEFLTKVSLVV